jgi:hypothetical protein
MELLSERSHPDATGLDDGEVTSPVVTCRYQPGEPLSDIARPRHRRAQQDDTARTRQRRCSCQFAGAECAPRGLPMPAQDLVEQAIASLYY